MWSDTRQQHRAKSRKSTLGGLTSKHSSPKLQFQKSHSHGSFVYASVRRGEDEKNYLTQYLMQSIMVPPLVPKSSWLRTCTKLWINPRGNKLTVAKKRKAEIVLFKGKNILKASLVPRGH